MDPWTQQVLDAILRQQGGIPQGSPTTPPNFTMPGQGPRFNPNVLSGEGMVPPGSGNLPVPYQGGNLPAVIPPQAAEAGPVSEGVAGAAPSEAASALGGAGATGEGAAAAAPGLLSRIIGGAKFGGKVIAKGGLPIMAASLASANDSNPNEDQGRYGSLTGDVDSKYPDILEPSGQDTTISDALKGVGRGVINAGDSVSDLLFKTREQKAEEAATGKKGKESPTETSVVAANSPTIDDALGLTPQGSGKGGRSGGAPVGGREFSAGAGGRNPMLDALEGNLIANKPPGYRGGDPKMAEEYKDAAGEAAFFANTKGLPPGEYGLGARDAATKSADIQYKMGQSALALAATERQTKWAVDAAQQGLDIEKENYAENGMKIHMGRGNNPTIMESTVMGDDGKPQKVLRNLDDSAFGIVRDAATGGIDPHASADIMGAKFTHLDKDPMGKPLLLIGNIQKDGQMASVLNMPEMAKAMPDLLDYAHRSLLGVGQDVPKDQVDAKIMMMPKKDVHNSEQAVIRGGLLAKMQQDPEFRQKLINMQYNLHQQPGMPAANPGMTPAGEALSQAPDNGDNAPPQEGDEDYLTQIDNARK